MGLLYGKHCIFYGQITYFGLSLVYVALWVGLSCFNQCSSVHFALLLYSFCHLWWSSSWCFCFSFQVWIPSLCCVLSLSKASVPKVTSVNSLMTSLWRGNVRKEACMWMAEMMSWRKASPIVFLWGYIFSMILCTLTHWKQIIYHVLTRFPLDFGIDISGTIASVFGWWN